MTHIRDLHRITQLATLLRAEASLPPPRQLAWPWGPPPSPVAPRRPDPAHETVELLLDLVVDAEWLAYPQRTCRAINPAACDHEACTIVREYRARLAVLTRRAHAVLGGRR